jgi:polyhydroxyalkanoic acid synthase PhaR subunit
MPDSASSDMGQAWRNWQSQAERQWNEYLNTLMATDEFSEGLGRNLDVFLHFQKTMNEAMGSYFMAMNVPSRTDVLELGERLISIENRIASIEAALVRLSSAPREARDAPRPKRTKKPASTGES